MKRSFACFEGAKAILLAAYTDFGILYLVLNCDGSLVTLQKREAPTLQGI